MHGSPTRPHYDDWPVEVSGDNIDATSSNLKELLGENDDDVIYLNAQMVDGAFKDPWGTTYRFRLIDQSKQNPQTETFGASVAFPNRFRQL
jgi:hypothetical protein